MSPIDSREFWLPGRWQAGFFLLLVLLGLGVWVLRVPFLGEAFHTGELLYALLALMAGFVLPRGFYLWGIAVVIAHPIAAVALTAYQQAQGADIVRGGAVGWLGFAFVLVIMTLPAAVLATIFSAMGAGLRVLSGRLRRGRSRTPQDLRAQ